MALNLKALPHMRRALSFLQQGLSSTQHLDAEQPRRAVPPGIRRELSETVAAARRDILDAFTEGTDVSDPEGGFILWVTLPPGNDTMALYYRALEENILIAPGCLFTRKKSYSNCMRIHAGEWGPNQRRAIARMAEMLKQPAAADC